MSPIEVSRESGIASHLHRLACFVHEIRVVADNRNAASDGGRRRVGREPDGCSRTDTDDRDTCFRLGGHHAPRGPTNAAPPVKGGDTFDFAKIRVLSR